MEVGMDNRAFVGERINKSLEYLDPSVCLFTKIQVSGHAGIWSNDSCWGWGVWNW